MKKKFKSPGLLPKCSLRSLALLVAILTAISSFAYDFEVDGIYYNINGNEASVTGRGHRELGVWQVDTGYAGDIVIPEQVSFNGKEYPVTSIANDAFNGSPEMTSITIPETVMSIGSGAFAHCSGLTEITIPSEITIINAWTFWNCSGLSEFSIPSSVTTIDYYAFDGCSGLNSIYIPESVTNMDSNPFPNCSNLSSIIVDSNNPSFDSRDNCNAIIRTMDNTMITGCMNTVIPNSVEYIMNAFAGATNLQAITIPASIQMISPGVFQNCTGLESIIVDSENPIYDSRDNCNAIIWTELDQLVVGCKTSTFPQTVTSIGAGAFSNNDALTSIVIPDNIAGIEGYAFGNCKGLMSVTIKSGYIQPDAFTGCSNLQDLIIGQGVTGIAERAFDECEHLSSITVESGNAVFDSRNNCNAIIMSETNSLLLGCSNTIIPNTVTNIGIGAFERHSSGLRSITIPNSVTGIESNAFSNCKDLESVTMSNNVTYINSFAFAMCEKLANMSLPNSLQKIDSYVFSGCSSLTSLIIPKSVTTIGYSFISGCSNLSSISVEEGNGVYDSRDNCNAIIKTGSNTLAFGIKSTIIPSTVTSIDYQAFYNCIGLTEIIIPSSVNYIGANAFYGSFNLKTIYSLSDNPPVCENNGYLFSNVTFNTATLYVPQSAIEQYQMANIWKYFNNIADIESSNALAIRDTSALHGERIVIPISMNNIKSITAFQTDLYLPEGFDLVKEDGDYLVELSDRKGRDHVIMANDLDDGGIRIISYSATVKPYSGNEGELFYITVKIPDDGDGDYTIMLKNTLLTTTDHEELNAANASCTVTVYPYIMGDANNSGTVSVTDIVVTARYILNYHPDPFVFGAADMNGDNNISVTDIVMIAQMIMDGATIYPRHAPARGVNLSRMSGDAMSIDGTRHSVSIALDNAADYIAFQFDLQLPEGMTADNFALTDGSGSHTLDVNLLDNGKTRLLCYAPTLQALSSNEETLLTFDVTSDAGANRDIVVDGIEMVTADCQTVNLNAFTIKLDNLTSVDELKANVRIYSDGQSIVVESPADVTVNVSDPLGHTTLVKAKAGRTVIPTDGNGIYIVNAGGAMAKLMLK